MQVILFASANEYESFKHIDLDWCEGFGKAVLCGGCNRYKAFITMWENITIAAIW